MFLNNSCMHSQTQVAFAGFSLTRRWRRGSAGSRVPADVGTGSVRARGSGLSSHEIPQLVTKRGTGRLARRVELTTRTRRWILKDGQPKIKQNKQYPTR